MASQPQSQPPPVNKLRQLDPSIWKTCAGLSFQTFTVNSRVYYFPQGHVEQSNAPHLVTLSPPVYSKPIIHCRISAVYYLANPLTDEVFARLLLVPIIDHSDDSLDQEEESRMQEEEPVEEDKVVSHTKVLSSSDVYHGNFTVRKSCAELIFPQLDGPVQKLSITDVHGKVWEITHSYRAAARNHKLTTGWNKFVDSKKLVTGDSVVFMRNSKGELFAGVRRALRWGSTWEGNYGGGVDDEGFSRSGRWRFSVEAVVEASEMAARNMPFEVDYYPRIGWPDFVMKAEMVEEAMRVLWCVGLEVEMAIEDEDSSKIYWVLGKILALGFPDGGDWIGSSWRMLQVKWDDPDELNESWVSPWQVKCLLHPQSLEATFPPPVKEIGVHQNSELLPDGEEELFYPTTGVTNSTVGHWNASSSSCNTYPDVMLGARDMSPNLETLSPKLRTDSSPPLESLPPLENFSPEADYWSSPHSFGTKF